MHRLSLLVTLVGIAPAATTAQAPATRAPAVGCESLAQLKLPDIRITEAASVDARENARVGVRVPHCRVRGVVGKEIRFLALLPIGWNGRFLMGGGGGFVGSVNAPTEEVNVGYATSGTDTGHEGSGIQAGWALGNLERVVNYGHLAVHRVAEATKAVVRAYYGADAEYSYFLGCSNGGRQALMEAQRYPGDFDGIVSGAPAFDFTNIAHAFIKNIKAAFPVPTSPTPILTPDALKVIEAKVLEACDAADGIKDDTIDDPRSCRFRLESVPVCPGSTAGPGCLTRPQHRVAATVYRAAADRAGRVYPGQPVGGEGQQGGWADWITGRGGQPGSASLPSAQWGFGTEFFKYLVFHDSTWNYATYDLANARRDTRLAATVLNADNPDLSAFAGRGGRLLLWHGWSDPALNALSTIDYHGQVLAKTPAAQDHVRLFLMPGVLHCAGGTGPDRVDWAKAISTWVETKTAPERIVAAKMGADGKPTRTRPLCGYPARAVYRGTGSTDEEVNFECQAP
ncbi:MAG: tannase/feruloyl esterase family alpha/beta hydrolase [Gemmatimonadales bacterium]